MSIYHFKTNMKCTGCVDTLKPHMEKLVQSGDVKTWSVDLQSPEKLLVVETITLSPEKVKHLVREAGYDAEFAAAPGAKN